MLTFSESMRTAKSAYNRYLLIIKLYSEECCAFNLFKHTICTWKKQKKSDNANENRLHFLEKPPRCINICFYALYNVIFISIKQSGDIFLRQKRKVILSANQFKKIPEMLVLWKGHQCMLWNVNAKLQWRNIILAKCSNIMWSNESFPVQKCHFCIIITSIDRTRKQLEILLLWEKNKGFFSKGFFSLHFIKGMKEGICSSNNV